MTRSIEDYEMALGLVGAGYNDCQISRLTGIPRGTVRDWRRGKSQNTRRGPEGDYSCRWDHDFSGLPQREYCYLLGMYLGDGYIASGPRSVYRMRISCDAKYPGIIDECVAAMDALMPGQRARKLKLRSSRCVEVGLSSKHWPCLFPQAGPGRKHERLIKLEPWQVEYVERDPESLVRGLIHSDGCRTVANDRGVMSVRYHFSNRSEDIKGIYCDALDRLGIPWTRPSHKHIAVYRKAATARLDEFVGPKY